MAYYKWLTRPSLGREPEWPEPYEWSEPIYPRAGGGTYTGYQTYVGAHVCLNVPSGTSAQLWLVETLGASDSDRWSTAWEQVKLVEYFGTIHPGQAAEMAIAWARCVFKNDFPTGDEQQYPLIAGQFDLLESGDYDRDDPPVWAQYTPLHLAARAAASPTPIAWGCAKQIPLHCGIKNVLLDMARETTQRLEIDEQVQMPEVSSSR